MEFEYFFQAQFRKYAFNFVFGLFVMPFGIGPNKAVKFYYLAVCPKKIFWTGSNVCRGLFQNSLGHLAGYGALPNKVVNFKLAAVQVLFNIGRFSGNICRANG